MLRPLLAILLLCSVVLPAVASAATSPERIRTILRDCEDDGVLSGDYRPSELRDAARNIGTDLDQYSDCRDVLSAAELGGGGGGGTQGGGGSATGGSDPGAGAGRLGGLTDGLDPGAGAVDPGADEIAGGLDMSGPLLTPGTPEEQGALDELRVEPPDAAMIGGRPLELGAEGAAGAEAALQAAVGHELPVPLLVALGLLAAGGCVAGLVMMRRRFVGRRSPA